MKKTLGIAAALAVAFNGAAYAGNTRDWGLKWPYQLGEAVTDGSVYVASDYRAHGSLKNNEMMAIYTTPANASRKMNFQQAAGYCAKLDLGGHKDWRLPDLVEMDIMFGVRDERQLKGTLAPATLGYWTETPALGGSTMRHVKTLAEDRNGGHFPVYDTTRTEKDKLTVRCVRKGILKGR